MIIQDYSDSYNDFDPFRSDPPVNLTTDGTPLSPLQLARVLLLFDPDWAVCDVAEWLCRNCCKDDPEKIISCSQENCAARTLRDGWLDGYISRINREATWAIEQAIEDDLKINRFLHTLLQSTDEEIVDVVRDRGTKTYYEDLFKPSVTGSIHSAD